MTMETVKATISKMDGVIFEQSGEWLWISGNTYPNKEEIKSLGCRWSKKRQAWYWKPNNTVVELPKSEYSVTTRDGYLGAIAWDGSNAHQHLYGSDLSKAIREAFKKCNIKKVTVSCKTYTGGQSIYVKITPQMSDYIPYDDYFKKAIADGSWRHLHYDVFDEDGTRYDLHRIPELDQETQSRLYRLAVKARYDSYIEGNGYINHITNDGLEDIFQPHFIEKLYLIRRIVDSFNYDDSNGQVDYFDRGFYEHLEINALKTA